MPICLHVCMSIFISVCLSLCLSVCLSVCCLSVCMSFCMSVCLYVCITVCMSICLYVCFTVSMSPKSMQQQYRQGETKICRCCSCRGVANATPIPSLGIRLSDEAIRMAVGHRLGSHTCQPHTCVLKPKLALEVYTALHARSDDRDTSAMLWSTK